MKTFVKLVTLVVLVSIVAACGGTPTPTVAVPTTPPVVPATAVPTAAPTEIPLTAAEQWAKDNGVGPYQPATLDWDSL